MRSHRSVITVVLVAATISLQAAWGQGIGRERGAVPATPTTVRHTARRTQPLLRDGDVGDLYRVSDQRLRGTKYLAGERRRLRREMVLDDERLEEGREAVRPPRIAPAAQAAEWEGRKDKKAGFNVLFR